MVDVMRALSGVFWVGVSYVRPGSVSVPTVDVRQLRRPAALSVVLHAARRPTLLQVHTTDARSRRVLALALNIGRSTSSPNH